MYHKAKTLIILTPGFPKDEADTTCIPPQQVFVKALQKANPELNIVVLTFTYPFSSGEYDWHGIRVISFGNKWNSRVLGWATPLRVWLALQRLEDKFQIVGLLSFWLGKCAAAGSYFARKYHLKHYGWLLGQDAKAGNKYVKKIRPVGDELIAISDFIQQGFYKNYGIHPRHVIPVGVDTSLFEKAPVSRDIDILGAGSLIPLKQYDVFIDQINFLKCFYPDIKVAICGDGSEKAKLLELIAHYGLQNNIQLLGELPHATVLTMMQRAKVFLHPSNYEGFSTVCLEALYAGARVISFVQPMDAPIKNWDIARDKKHMLELLKVALQEERNVYEQVLPYNIEDSAERMLRLFE